MRVVCAWCGKVLNEGPEHGDISHGMCKECGEYFTADAYDKYQMFLDRIQAPLLVIDPNGKAVTANSAAKTILQKDFAKIHGFNGGDIIECAYAKLPGGCGQTEHCTACTIRNTVMMTHIDGKPRTRVKTSRPIGTVDENVEMVFIISTEKVGEVVMLRVDEVHPK